MEHITTSPTSELPAIEQSLTTQADPSAQQEKQPVVQDTLVPEEEIEEELIIEDFTIDGICGVY